MKILFIAHEATRTGAPLVLLKILESLKKSISCDLLLLSGGVLLDEFLRHVHRCWIQEKKVSERKKTFTVKPLNLFRRIKRRLANKRASISRNIYLENRRKRYDIIYCNSVVTLEEGIRIKKTIQKPLVFHNHETIATFERHGFDKIISENIHLIDLIITVSEETARGFIDRFGFDPDRVHVIPPFAIKPENKTGSKRFLQQQFGISDDTFIIGSSGVISDRKGFDVFIQTLLQFSKLNPDSNFVFMWIGRTDEYLTRYLDYDLERMGLKDKLILTGEVEDPVPYYNLLDVFFMCSREESFGMVALENAFLGKPVMLFKDATGFQEFCTPENSVLIPYLDTCFAAKTLTELKQNPQLCQKIGLNAEHTAKTGFTEELFIQRLREALHQSIGFNLARNNSMLSSDSKLDTPSKPVSVSVAMATYNGERFLKEQVLSVINQTYKPSEIIICDDGSTDSTVTILEQLCLDFPDAHIKLYVNKNNLGYQKNFEKAVKLCTGEYIALCDQDDVWLPNKMETLLSNIGSNMMIHSDASLIDKNGKVLCKSFTRQYGKKHKPVFLDLIMCPYITGCTALFRKELVPETVSFPVSIPHDYFLSLLAPSGSITYCNRPLVLYRQHENNIIGANEASSGNFLSKVRFFIKKNLRLRRFRNYIFTERSKFIRTIYISIYDQLDAVSRSQLEWVTLFLESKHKTWLPDYKYHKEYMKLHRSLKLGFLDRFLFYVISWF